MNATLAKARKVSDMIENDADGSGYLPPIPLINSESTTSAPAKNDTKMTLIISTDKDFKGGLRILARYEPKFLNKQHIKNLNIHF